MMTAETLRKRSIDRVLRGEVKVRSAPNLDPGFFSQSFRQLVGGTNGTLTDPYLQSEWVYAAIMAISKAVSAVPLYAVSGDAKKPTKIGGDWQKFFDSPNPRITRAQFWAATVCYLYTRAGCKWVLIGKIDSVGEKEIPVEAWPLPANYVEALDESGNILTDIVKSPSKWRVTIANGSTTIKKIYEPWQIVDLKFFNPSNPLYGFLPLDPLMNAASFGFSAMTWGAAYFANNVDPGGWIENGPTNEIQIKQLKQGIYDEHGGPTKRGKLMVLPGTAKFVQNTRSQRDMEYIEGQRWSREAILAVLGVPAAILGITNDVTFANFEGSMAIFYKNTVLPILKDFEDALHGQLMKRVDDSWAQFDVESISYLSIDRAAKLTQLDTITRNGWSADQANEYLNLGLPKSTPVITEGDPLLAALNKTTTEAAPTAVAPPDPAKIQSIIESVVSGAMPAASAKTLIMISFPGVNEESATAMVEAAASQSPTADEPPRFAAPFFKRGPSLISDRSGYVAEYVRTIVIPNERKLNAAMRRYLAALGIEQRKRILDWLKKNKLGSSDIATFTPADVDAILFQRERWDAALRAAGTPSIEATVKSALKATAEEVGGAFLPMSNPRVSELMGDTIATLVQVNATTQDRIRAQLLTSAAQGETIQQAQARLTPWVQDNPARALLIARTENGMASSGARFVGLQEAEIEKHEWVNAGSGDIRDSHERVNGEVVDIGTKFKNGLRYPHEIGADPSEVCNCRCEALAV